MKIVYNQDLGKLREIFGDEKFAIAHIGGNTNINTLDWVLEGKNTLFDIDLIMLPKTVTIKEDLTVWSDGQCIINGMKTDHLFVAANDLKLCTDNVINSLTESEKFTKAQLNLFKRGIVKEKKVL